MFAAVALFVSLAFAQQQCYYGPGAEHRGPSSLVPCKGSGTSACCLLGDTCLSGNTCYNYKTGNLYQYGCTDITYQDSSCPYKCGFDIAKSPWTAMEYCGDVDGVNNTWICHAPESCSCSWNSTLDLLVLSPIGCKEMGSNARVALVAPSTLAPYVSLPSTFGGSTGYYSTTTISGTATWISTAIDGYTPSPIAELTTYQAGPSSVVQINPTALPLSTTLPAARSYSASLPANSGVAPTASPAPTVSRLSTGAQAGIGAGAGVAGLLLLSTIILLCCRHHRRRPVPGPAPQERAQDEALSEKYSLHHSQHSQLPSPYSEHSAPWQPPLPMQYFPELHSSTSPPPSFRPEDSHRFRTVELPSQNQIHELSSYKSRDNMDGAPRYI